MKNLTKKTRGTVSHYGDDSFEFTPYGKGEPVYELRCKDLNDLQVEWV